MTSWIVILSVIPVKSPTRHIQVDNLLYYRYF
jgi:hypothetical protein